MVEPFVREIVYFSQTLNHKAQKSYTCRVGWMAMQLTNVHPIHGSTFQD